MEFNKYMFGSVAILSLVGLQIAAWYLGFDGQITIAVTSGITGILAFITGYEARKFPIKPQTH